METRRMPNRSVAAPIVTVDRHSAPVPARFASSASCGVSRNKFCSREGVIRITTTIAAVNIQVLTTESRQVHRYGVVSVITRGHLAEPFTNERNRLMTRGAAAPF